MTYDKLKKAFAELKKVESPKGAGHPPKPNELKRQGAHAAKVAHGHKPKH